MINDDAKKADGWVAWHPNEVDLRLVRNKDYDGSPISEQDAIDIITRSWAKGAGELSNGWRIRPAKFQFLDEPVMEQNKKTGEV